MPSFSSWHWVYSMLCSCFHKYEINIRVNIGDVLLCKTSLNSYHQINSCVCSDSGLHMTHKPLIFDCLQTQGAVTLSNTAPEELPCRFHCCRMFQETWWGFFPPLIEMSWKCHEARSAPAYSTDLFCAFISVRVTPDPSSPCLVEVVPTPCFVWAVAFSQCVISMTDCMLLTCHESLPDVT